MSYIYAKVRIINSNYWYKEGETYECAYWGNKLTLLDIDEEGYYYSYGPKSIKIINVGDVEYIEKPDI